MTRYEDEPRFVEKDYSIGGGVTMVRKDFDHGFHFENQNDRIRGKMGTKRGEHFGKGPRNWKLTDERIRENVCEALYESPFVDATDIEVEVLDGVVHLVGWVNTREEKRESETIIEELTGVHDVRNDLHMRNRRIA